MAKPMAKPMKKAGGARARAGSVAAMSSAGSWVAPAFAAPKVEAKPREQGEPEPVEFNVTFEKPGAIGIVRQRPLPCVSPLPSVPKTAPFALYSYCLPQLRQRPLPCVSPPPSVAKTAPFALYSYCLPQLRQCLLPCVSPLPAKTAPFALCSSTAC